MTNKKKPDSSRMCFGPSLVCGYFLRWEIASSEGESIIFLFFLLLHFLIQPNIIQYNHVKLIWYTDTSNKSTKPNSLQQHIRILKPWEFQFLARFYIPNIELLGQTCDCYPRPSTISRLCVSLLLSTQNCGSLSGKIGKDNVGARPSKAHQRLQHNFFFINHFEDPTGLDHCVFTWYLNIRDIAWIILKTMGLSLAESGRYGLGDTYR